MRLGYSTGYANAFSPFFCPRVVAFPGQQNFAYLRLHTPRNMEGRVDQAIIDCWRQRRLGRGDGRPERGRGLEDEDNDEYQSRMEFPPDDVVEE